MDAKKVGAVILATSIVLLIIFIVTFQNLQQESQQLGCFEAEGCGPVQVSFSLVNLGFGVFGFILALGFYMVVFAKGEKAIMGHLEDQKQQASNDEKFSILLQGLDEFEKQVIQEIRKQDGITQNTLKLRVDMSKAKLSQVLGSLEKKGLIKRMQHKKTLAIHLAVGF